MYFVKVTSVLPSAPVSVTKPSVVYSRNLVQEYFRKMEDTWWVSWNSVQLAAPHFSTRISYISRSLCVKFRARYLNMLPLHTCELRENWYRESLRYLRACIKFRPVLCIFDPIWNQFAAGNIHKIAVSISWASAERKM